MMMIRLLPLLLLLGLVPCCSPYAGEFAKAVEAAPVPPKDPTGPWKGRWLSKHNGHEGPLWCMVTPVEGRPQTYQFRYRAGWAGIRFGDYNHTAPVDVQPDSSFRLKSAMKLPAGLGTYTVDGSLTRDTFHASYASDTGDHGTMTLKRP